MKVILSGGWSYGNIGDEAIAKSTIYLLKQYFPAEDLIICAYDPDNFYYHHKQKTILSVHNKVDKYRGITAQGVADVIKRPEKYDMKQIADLLDCHTLFIMGGGGYFNDRWETQFISRIIEIELAKSRGAKVAVIGQSIGPVTREINKKLLIKVMNQCDYINVRDLDSQRFLQSLLPNKKILCSIDTALIISDVYQQKNLKESVVNVMAAGYSKYTSIKGDLIPNYFINKLLGRILLKYYLYDIKTAIILRSIIKKKNVKIRFIMSTNWKFDLAFTKRLTYFLPKNSYEVIINPDIDTLCDYLTRGRVLISSKMHPIIISTSYNIDSIAISYNFKIDNFMNSIGKKQNCYRNDRIKVHEIIDKVCSLYYRSDPNPSKYINQGKESIYQMGKDLKELFEENDLKDIEQ
ncbi:colanic acid biosynthesis protein [Clostridiales bacterium CHKCI001]|nr:colanic acid biosynthesis protein [Clostridiales bacterium CHKCI001]